MKCSGLLIWILLGNVTVDSENRFNAILNNVTSNSDVTKNCGLFLKSLVYNVSKDSSNRQDGEGSTTKCYDIESTEGSIQVKCRKPLLIVSNTSKNAQTNRTIIQKWTPERILNYTTDPETFHENIGDNLTSTICFPTSSCTNEDVSIIFYALFGKEIDNCQSNDDVLSIFNLRIIIAVAILACFIFMMIVSTVYGLYCSIKAKEPLHECLVAFSVHRNGQRIFKTARSSSELHCLNGVRVLSMIWIIVLHTFSEVGFAYFSKNDEFLQWESSWGSMIVRSGTFAVDSFLAVGGTLLVYNFMAKRTKVFNEKFNIFHHYVHRYIRLTPPLAAAILVNATLLSDVDSGKYKDYLNSRLAYPCQKRWWSSLLYVQNYVNADDMCLSHTWYLSADMQLYLISPLILLPLWKKPKIGIAILVLSIPITVIIPFCIAYENKLVGMLGIFPHQETIVHHNKYLYEYYFKTHARATPWFMGMLLGYALFGIKFANIKSPKIKKLTVALLWCICLAVMVICIYGGHTLEGPTYDRLNNSLFIALARPAWTLCVVWVIFACAFGYGGPINWILSNRVNQILIPFTYSIYIVHLPLIYMAISISDTGKESFTILYMIVASCIIFVVAFVISIFWVLAFEFPMTILEKYIIKRPPFD